MRLIKLRIMNMFPYHHPFVDSPVCAVSPNNSAKITPIKLKFHYNRQGGTCRFWYEENVSFD